MMDTSIVDLDFGPLTRQELDTFYVNMRHDDGSPDFEPVGGFFKVMAWL